MKCNSNFVTNNFTEYDDRTAYLSTKNEHWVALKINAPPPRDKK
jgi:hypothetical protein